MSLVSHLPLASLKASNMEYPISILSVQHAIWADIPAENNVQNFAMFADLDSHGFKKTPL